MNLSIYLLKEQYLQTTYSSISQDDLLGSHGENALNFLEKYGAIFKVEKIFQDETKNEYLLYYVNKWMERIFQGFRLQLSPIAEADAVGFPFYQAGFGIFDVFAPPKNLDDKIDHVACPDQALLNLPLFLLFCKEGAVFSSCKLILKFNVMLQDLL